MHACTHTNAITHSHRHTHVLHKHKDNTQKNCKLASKSTRATEKISREVRERIKTKENDRYFRNHPLWLCARLLRLIPSLLDAFAKLHHRQNKPNVHGVRTLCQASTLPTLCPEILNPACNQKLAALDKKHLYPIFPAKRQLIFCSDGHKIPSGACPLPTAMWHCPLPSGRLAQTPAS